MIQEGLCVLVIVLDGEITVLIYHRQWLRRIYIVIVKLRYAIILAHQFIQAFIKMRKQLYQTSCGVLHSNQYPPNSMLEKALSKLKGLKMPTFFSLK